MVVVIVLGSGARFSRIPGSGTFASRLRILGPKPFSRPAGSVVQGASCFGLPMTKQLFFCTTWVGVVSVSVHLVKVSVMRSVCVMVCVGDCVVPKLLGADDGAGSGTIVDVVVTTETSALLSASCWFYGSLKSYLSQYS